MESSEVARLSIVHEQLGASFGNTKTYLTQTRIVFMQMHVMYATIMSYRKTYPGPMDRTASFYAQPSYGGGFPIFSGSRRQRGGGIFGALARIALPFAKRVGSSLLKNGVRQAVGLAQDVASDVVAGKNIGQSIKSQGKSRLKQFGRRAIKTGTKELRNFTSAGPKASRKRKASQKKTPPGKKRRRANF